MRLRALGIVTALGMVGALAFAGAARADEGGHHGGRPLSATLRGASEVPGPGDPDGLGTASLTINPGQRRICFQIHVSAISLPAIAAHIHQGPAGVAGPVIVTLAPPDLTGSASGCVSAPRSTVMAIMRDPAAYYVNVHTVDFPGGALRGQLGNGSGQHTTGDQGALSVTLRGTNEVPGPGDPDGSGSASITLDTALNQVCFSIHVSGLFLPATAAFIGQGSAGVVGPAVVSLVPPGSGGVSSGCMVGLPAGLVAAIAANPSGYYVNVITADFPSGAVRGQLSGCGGGGGDDLKDSGGHGGGHDGCGDDDQGDDD